MLDFGKFEQLEEFALLTRRLAMAPRQLEYSRQEESHIRVIETIRNSQNNSHLRLPGIFKIPRYTTD